jgi:hypothetical protein
VITHPGALIVGAAEVMSGIKPTPITHIPIREIREQIKEVFIRVQ